MKLAIRLAPRWRRAISLVLAGLAATLLVAAAPTPAQAQFSYPVISCQAQKADYINYSRQYSEGTSYWYWQARTPVECHWFSPDGSNYDYQVHVYVTLHYANNSTSAIGSTWSTSASQTLPWGTYQHFISYIYASYYWTSCSPSQQYVLRTEAYYRYKRQGTSSWTRWDSFQNYSVPTANLYLCY